MESKYIINHPRSSPTLLPATGIVVHHDDAERTFSRCRESASGRVGLSTVSYSTGTATRPPGKPFDLVRSRAVLNTISRRETRTLDDRIIAVILIITVASVVPENMMSFVSKSVA